MLPIFFLTLTMSVFAQNDLSYYISRWKYKPLEVAPKRTALYNLGSKLFSLKALAGNNNISCQDCHSKESFTADGLPLGLGEGATGVGKNRTQREGLVLARHSMSLYNTGMKDFDDLFWDGRVSRDVFGGWSTPERKLNGNEPELKEVAATFDSTLSVQTLFPLASPEEMLGKNSKLTRLEAWDQVLKKALENYRPLFHEAYPDVQTFNIAHVGNALAEFIRHEFLAINTPWDQYLRGKKDVLSVRMKRGAVLFHSRANCIFCHNGNQFTNFSFENIGVPQIHADDPGRFAVTRNPRDLYAFKVPPLRNVGVTAPYMHSGVFKNLREVVEHYSEPVQSLRNFTWNAHHPSYHDPLILDTDGVRNDNREKTMSTMLARKLTLNQEEKNDLICFLAVALTDISLQNEVLKNGALDGISDCLPGKK